MLLPRNQWCVLSRLISKWQDWRKGQGRYFLGPGPQWEGQDFAETPKWRWAEPIPPPLSAAWAPALPGKKNTFYGTGGKKWFLQWPESATWENSRIGSFPVEWKSKRGHTARIHNESKWGLPNKEGEALGNTSFGKCAHTGWCIYTFIVPEGSVSFQRKPNSLL